METKHTIFARRLQLADELLLCSREIMKLTAQFVVATRSESFDELTTLGAKMRAYTHRINQLTEEVFQ